MKGVSGILLLTPVGDEVTAKWTPRASEAVVGLEGLKPNLALAAREHVDLAHGDHGTGEVAGEDEGERIGDDAAARAGIQQQRLVGREQPSARGHALEVLRVEPPGAGVEGHAVKHPRFRTLLQQRCHQPQRQCGVARLRVQPVVDRDAPCCPNGVRTCHAQSKRLQHH